MKKTYLLKGILLAFLAFQFSSCENEPLTGEFVDEEQNEAEAGEFVAQIAGQQFVAAETTAILNAENELVITGSKSGGELITLAITNAAVGTFNLSTGASNENGGAYFDGSQNLFPYISAQAFGGSGQLKIDAMDTAAQTVTGTFSFVGYRMKVDGNGDPIFDGNGNPVLENIEINNGAFNSIPYEIDGTGGGGNGDPDPDNEFFAKVDGVDFMPDSITVSEPVIDNIHMIKVEAQSSTGEYMRIDVPRSLGVGTFEMVQISDGTELTALYNPGNGAENLTSNPGSITISEFDLVAGVLKATFEFTATDPLNQNPEVAAVTEGNITVFFEGIPGANNSFVANIDSTPYTPDEIEIETSVVNQYPRITISTIRGDANLTITFPLTITEGSFEMGNEVTVGDEIVGSYTPVIGTSITYTSIPGTMIITNYDMDNGIIEGTFNFSAVDATGQDPTVYQISGGEFLVVLP